MFFENKTRPLPDIFQKYAGVTIPHETKTFGATPEHPERGFDHVVPSDEGGALIKEIYKLAADHGYNISLGTPGSMRTQNHDVSRINIKVSQDWVIQNECYNG